MTTFSTISILTTILLLVFVLILWMKLQRKEKCEKCECCEVKKGVSGSNDHNERRRAEKEERKRKVLEFLKEKGRVTNNDVENLVGVSDSIATVYLDELEKEGKIRQVGNEGRGVFYESNG